MLSIISLKNHRQLDRIILDLNTETGQIQFTLVDKMNHPTHFHSAVLPEFGMTNLTALRQLAYPDQGVFIVNCLTTYLTQFPNRIFIQTSNGQTILVFAEQGLKGGGRLGLMFTSSLKVTVGILLIGTGVGVSTGAALLSSGISSGVYAYQNTDETVSNETYLKKAAIGATAGFLTIHTFKKVGEKLGTGIKAAIASSIVNRLTNDVLNSTLLDQPFPNLATSAVKGAATGLITGSLSNLTPPDTSNLLNNTLTNGVSGGIIASASTITDNLMEGKKVTDGLTESAVIGAAVSTAISGVRAMNQHMQPAIEPSKQNNPQLTPDKKALEAAEKSLEEAKNSRDAANEAKKNRDTARDNIKKEYEDAQTVKVKFKVDGKKVTPEQAADHYMNGKKINWDKKGGKLGIGAAHGNHKQTAVPTVDTTTPNNNVNAAQNKVNQLRAKITVDEIKTNQSTASSSSSSSSTAIPALARINIEPRPEAEEDEQADLDSARSLTDSANDDSASLSSDESDQADLNSALSSASSESDDSVSLPAEEELNQPIKHASYPPELNQYGVYQRKVTPARIAHTLWLVNRAQGQPAHDSLLRRYSLWCQNHFNQDGANQFINQVNQESKKYIP